MEGREVRGDERREREMKLGTGWEMDWISTFFVGGESESCIEDLTLDSCERIEISSGFASG